MLPDPDKDSRSVMIINGASMALGVVAVVIWLISSPDMPGSFRIGLGAFATMTAIAFFAAVIHRATTKTTNVIQLPTPA